ncbi:hypothetical protein ACS0TY_035880 [Phlomoides rotata]
MAGTGSTVVIFVFVSFGCFFLFCCSLFALWFFLIKKKKKESKQEAEIIRDDEHFKVKEDIVEGPFGRKEVVISMEKDKHFEERISKNEKVGKSDEIDVEAGDSAANRYVEYKQ